MTSADEAGSFAVLDAYVAAGGTLVDTADVYSAWVPGNSGGETQTVIGRWLARRGRRDGVQIAIKVGGHPETKGLAPATIPARAVRPRSRAPRGGRREPVPLVADAAAGDYSDRLGADGRDRPLRLTIQRAVPGARWTNGGSRTPSPPSPATHLVFPDG